MRAPKQFFILLALMATGLTGCKTLGGGVTIHSPGPATHQDLPPAHAPAYGRRAQQRYHYHYYPDAQVYFDLDRKLYFYISANRWTASITLPQYFRLRLGEQRQMLEMDTDRPYQDFHVHKKKYPPGQAKKKNKGRKKDKKDNGNGRGNKGEDRY